MRPESLTIPSFYVKLISQMRWTHQSWRRLFITVTSHEHHGVSNHRQLLTLPILLKVIQGPISLTKVWWYDVSMPCDVTMPWHRHSWKQCVFIIMILVIPHIYEFSWDMMTSAHENASTTHAFVRVSTGQPWIFVFFKKVVMWSFDFFLFVWASQVGLTRLDAHVTTL